MNPQIETLLWVLLWIAVLVLVVYIIGSIFAKGLIVQTHWEKGLKHIDGDHTYYLPAANVVMKATAKVVVTKEADTSKIIGAKLAELAFETTVQLVPDTKDIFALQYQASVFSDDDLKFSTDPSGLLNGINLTAEDRITNIISGLTEAPKIILSGEQAAEARSFKASEVSTGADGPVITETKEYTNSFLLLTSEIRAKKAERIWTINIDGTDDVDTTVDASFTAAFDIPASETPLCGNKQTFNGILSRPSQTVIMTISKKNDPLTPAVQYQLVIPDESRLVITPIKRSSFVKKTYSVKLVNGALTESAINKPSEIEGFISIPIKIGKALVSIPAQLLSFKIENIKRQTSLETEQDNLLKAGLQNRKDQISGETELMKARLDAQIAALTHDSEISKTKLEAEKTLLEARKNVIAATTVLLNAKKESETTRKELEGIVSKIREEQASKLNGNHIQQS